MFACKETYKMASEKKYFYNSSYIIKHSSLTHLLMFGVTKIVLTIEISSNETGL
jgi:hypothetical protein